MSYSDGEKHIQADNFLPKEKIRELFPDAEYVTLSITMRRRRYARKSGGDEEGGKKRQKKKKKRSYGLSREKITIKNKAIHL
jgi:hypothetical protein